MSLHNLLGSRESFPVCRASRFIALLLSQTTKLHEFCSVEQIPEINAMLKHCDIAIEHLTKLAETDIEKKVSLQQPPAELQPFDILFNLSDSEKWDCSW